MNLKFIVQTLLIILKVIKNLNKNNRNKEIQFKIFLIKEKNILNLIQQKNIKKVLKELLKFVMHNL